MTHIVEPGETLYRLQVKYGVPVADIQKLNQLHGTTILPGQVLFITPEEVKATNVLALSDFCITPEPIPQEIADAIYLFHIPQLQRLEKQLGRRVYVSKRSGWRPKPYEIAKGRSGDSEHTYLEICYQGRRGAVDIMCPDVGFNQLIEAAMKVTEYRRVSAYYDHNFIHCDYKDVDGKRRFYQGGEVWEFKRYI